MIFQNSTSIGIVISWLWAVLCKSDLVMAEVRVLACSEPDNVTDLIGRELLTMYETEFTFKIVPNYESSQEAIFIDDHHSRRVLIYGQDICPRTLHRQGNLADQELCPWSVEMHHDENRIPKNIARAKCSCINCRRTSGRCSSIMSFLPVVRKTCNIITGLYQYNGMIKSVPVGCACDKASTGK
ncbi:hypothetical protein CHS0354_000036 [Potamilus streckersoni]|uniref:Interleukin 17-like protein n=1 Tax=Potamilus streckersoni TaxID=2493646 RepID=A0AAE0VK38_9BIVA|nr:hypothetical protein CHS0354_000036 [Potamilus streckersoni]